MLKVFQKPFGRTIGVAVVNLATGEVPLGFETENPPTLYCRLPYGKFGIRVKSTDPFDIVVRQDNKVILERARVEAGQHTFHRGDDGKPFMHAAAGQTLPHVLEDAGKPLSDQASEAGEPRRLFPESDPPFDAVVCQTQGVVIVQVRLSHVVPDFGPELPPDAFTVIRYQLNEPKAHARATAANYDRMLRPEPPPEGTPEILDPANPQVRLSAPKRTCCIAPDRHHHH